MEPLLKRSLIRSLALAAGVALAAYLLLWGLEVTHPELAIPRDAATSAALWTFPIVFVGNLILYAARSAGARRH
ncbi:MAG TPA: hypothetical protein VEV41_28480 [Terriglobales bacterium]|jgi:uncharacterized membrane protein|nr:hypothetical protein [Terriglobales bacterium]